MQNRKRIIGTTEDCVAAAEEELGRRFPPSYRQWLISNNGRDIEVIRLFPVFDARDPRKTWDSIVRNFNGNWQDWLMNVAEWEFDSSNLLPIGSYDNGDFCCLDYGNVGLDGEVPVVLWSHETGDTEPRAADFSDLLLRLENGEFDED